MTACKFSRSHAVALWNEMRMWWVLFPQDIWTRSECCFYYGGLGNEVTKPLCLPRWLASNQSYDSWSKAPCCIFPFWGKRCKYVSIKVSLFLSSKESCLPPKLSLADGILVLPRSNIVFLVIQQGLNMSRATFSMNKISHDNVPFPWALFTTHPCTSGE